MVLLGSNVKVADATARPKAWFNLARFPRVKSNCMMCYIKSDIVRSVIYFCCMPIGSDLKTREATILPPVLVLKISSIPIIK
jgi:hypothetical protein